MLLFNEDRARKIMEKYGFDGLIAATPENVTYFSNHRSLAQWYFKLQVFVIFPREKDIEIGMVAPLIDYGVLCITPAAVKDVTFYGKFCVYPPKEAGVRLTEIDKRALSYLRDQWPSAKENSLEALAKFLDERGLADKKLGVDSEGLFLGQYESLKKVIPRAQLNHASSVFREIRMVKTTEEIDRLRKAAQVLENAIKAALEVARPGLSEIDLAKVIKTEIIKQGALTFFANVYGGSKTAYLIRDYTDDKLKVGDSLFLDIGCLYECYVGDTGVTAVLGEPKVKLKAYYKALARAQQKALAAIRPGIKASELFSIALEEAKKDIPHYDRHMVGHGLGIGYSEPPILAPTDHTQLERGMVINIETPYYEIGFGGLQLEDTVLVTKQGHEFLTELSKELHIL